MRVLWWTHDFWPSIGGIQVIGAELIRGLQDRGLALSIVAQGDEGLPSDDDFHGIPLARFPFHSVLASRDVEAVTGLVARLRAHVKTFRPDLVHLHCLTYPAFFCERVLADGSIPLLVTRHAFVERAEERGGFALELLRRADWVACCSRAVLEEVRQLVPELATRSSAILNGLAAPDVTPSPVPTDPPVLLALGRLSAQKGFDLALDALELLRGRFPTVRLVVAGDGPARADLERQAARLGLVDRVDFSGWVPPSRVPEAIADSTALLVPSRGGEGFGLVALQAAQVGRPVVAARSGGLPEVVAEGETGLLFRPDDATDLARAVAALLEDSALARRLGRAASAWARERFASERYLDDYDRLYRELVGEAAA